MTPSKAATGKPLVLASDEPTIGLKPRKLHDDERIKAICEAVIRYASNGQLPDKEWIEELADLIEGLHDKIGGEMRANQDG